MAEEIKLDLDPKKILDAMTELSAGTKALAETIEKSLGKEAVGNLEKLEAKSETATNKIKGFFMNLGTSLKENLKTAFDLGAVMEGAKFGKGLGDGVKQVFEMERAFDRLNTRLGLSNKGLQDFKTRVGQAVAGTGQKLEDVLPGVESASALGGVKDTGQLASIAKTLGQAKGTTGEDTKGLSEEVVGILKDQGQKVTADSFKKTMDAIQGTRVNGAFGSAGAAGGAIRNLTQGLSPEMLKSMGLDTRKLGGLAAMASTGGDAGQEVLKHILDTAKTPGGKQLVNAQLGANIFDQKGKFNAGAFGNVDKKRFGQYSESVLGTVTGTEQADLSRFLDSMKSGMGQLKKVVDGSNETATQFDTATDNFASKVDKFKEKTKEAGREIGESVSHMANDLVKGNFKELGQDAMNVLKTGKENAGVGSAALATTIGIGAIAGGAANRLMSKIGGGGILGSALGGAAADAAGIQKVFVVNMGSGGMGDVLSKVGGGGLGALAATIGTATAAAGAGYLASKAFSEVTGMDGEGVAPTQKTEGEPTAPPVMDPQNFGKKAGEAFAEQTVKKTVYTNPSSPERRR
jgi:hypothetical protein